MIFPYSLVCLKTFSPFVVQLDSQIKEIRDSSSNVCHVRGRPFSPAIVYLREEGRNSYIGDRDSESSRLSTSWSVCIWPGTQVHASPR